MVFLKRERDKQKHAVYESTVLYWHTPALQATLTLTGQASPTRPRKGVKRHGLWRRPSRMMLQTGLSLLVS